MKQSWEATQYNGKSKDLWVFIWILVLSLTTSVTLDKWTSLVKLLLTAKGFLLPQFCPFLYEMLFLPLRRGSCDILAYREVLTFQDQTLSGTDTFFLGVPWVSWERGTLELSFWFGREVTVRSTWAIGLSHSKDWTHILERQIKRWFIGHQEMRYCEYWSYFQYDT